MAIKPAVLRYKGNIFSRRRIPAAVNLLKSELDNSPADEIFTSDQLKVPRARDYARHLDGYSLKVGAIRYFGNPKAIAALRAQVGQ